jgi:hypothetical protein
MTKTIRIAVDEVIATQRSPCIPDNDLLQVGAPGRRSAGR